MFGYADHEQFVVIDLEANKSYVVGQPEAMPRPMRSDPLNYVAHSVDSNHFVTVATVLGRNGLGHSASSQMADIYMKPVSPENRPVIEWVRKCLQSGKVSLKQK